MRKILQLFLGLSLMLLVLPPAVQAQERTITGTIISEDNKTPLAGVTIRVKGTRKITQTDANGKFSIKVNPGETLQITYVGYQTEEIKPGSGDALGISLKTADNMMGEVVVTAMDIKRNPRELGYSVQKVSGTEIQETQRENFLNSLAGRVAGLTLDQTSGVAGASSSVVLRGFNSLSLSNQPLYVVDGVILDNQSINETSGGGQFVGLASDRPNRNNDYQNRIADINPNDIETITVLKGPEATALYGSQASSGAIVITTRKAKSNKLGIQYDNSFRMQKVTRWPETLDGYSNGSNALASNIFRYFGPAYAPGTQLYDNKSTFFRTGFSQTHNLGVDFGFKSSTFRISGSFFDQKGVVPRNDYRRFNGRISNTTKLWKDKLEITPSFAYIKSENNKVLRSAGGYLLSLLIWPSTNDISNFESSTGDKLDIYSNLSTNGEYDNPLFNVNKNRSYDETVRKTATLGININPFKWLSISGRFGYDTYDMFGYMFYHPQSFYLSAGQGGTLDNYWRRYFGYNHTMTATYRQKIGKDFSLRLMGGTMWQDYETQMFAIYGTNIVDSVGGLNNLFGGNGKMYKNNAFVTDSDLKTLVGNYMDSNITRPNTRIRLLRNNYGAYNLSILRQLAFFGEFAISFRNLVFFNYTHRFEQASTLPEQNRKYDYPGGSLSIIMSDLIPSLKKGNVLSYWKIRTSLASTARLNSPYSTQSVFANNFASGGGFSYGFSNNNPDLRPERQSTYELGTELRLFKSRLNAEVTYYNTLNKGQIIENMRLSYGTGFVLNTQNAASTRNKGIEIALAYSILKNPKGLNWDMSANFNKMWNKVVGLPANLAEYYIADTWLYGNARGGLKFGGPTTSITSFGFARNNAGQLLINPTTGLPFSDGVFNIHGDRNPDFTLGWSNTLRWKNWKLSMLWDLKVGGDIYNGTNLFLTLTGRSKLTADRYKPRVVQGVLNDGLQNSANPTINTIVVIPAYNENYYLLAMPEEAFIERDVNWFRLRDITLNYTFNQNFIKALKSLSFFVTANDLILMTNYSGADPAVNGNVAGGKGVGGFGFDYGTLPSPISVNFGIRASF
ncbi:MAG: SusC/RagA family TonB-linked outer membrane protein [Sphingobacteriales bacterium]|nr:SusC/RagA family TonB-linked outer membrane protein [Sphingobacteriales bacterium]